MSPNGPGHRRFGGPFLLAELGTAEHAGGGWPGTVPLNDLDLLSSEQRGEELAGVALLVRRDVFR
jgi:hypothetical protein